MLQRDGVAFSRFVMPIQSTDGYSYDYRTIQLPVCNHRYVLQQCRDKNRRRPRDDPNQDVEDNDHIPHMFMFHILRRVFPPILGGALLVPPLNLTTDNGPQTFPKPKRRQTSPVRHYAMEKQGQTDPGVFNHGRSFFLIFCILSVIGTSSCDCVEFIFYCKSVANRPMPFPRSASASCRNNILS